MGERFLAGWISIPKTTFAIGVALLVTITVARGEEPRILPNGGNVLVIFAVDGQDSNRNGKPDSQEVAEYYAKRRQAPPENLLGLKLNRKDRKHNRWTYADFRADILKPVAARLASKDADGKALSERICYIVLCPGIPLSMFTHPYPPKDEKAWFRKTVRRSVDSYLISIDANLKIAVDEKTSRIAEVASGRPGTNEKELVLPIFGLFRPSPTGRRHFLQLRKLHPNRFNFYLVNRLGLDLKTARDMLDGAIYAQRYLRLPDGNEKATIRPAIWLDMKYKFVPDHVAAMSRLMPIVQGMKGSPFSLGQGLLRVWPLVIDNQPAEIGRGKALAHKPTVTATIAPGGVDAKTRSVTLVNHLKAEKFNNIPPVLYFPPHCRVACFKPPPKKSATTQAATTQAATTQAATTQTATTQAVPTTVPASDVPVASAKIVGVDASTNRLLLDSVEGFKPGYTIKYRWDGRFPTTDCFFFYGFYGLGLFEDVRQFPPGALGIHVDSSCIRWANGAINRGIAATFGAVREPLSIGIPYGDLMLLALADGYDWAEAVYGSLRLAQRWTGVVFGDPLYAPFRSQQLIDTTPPVLGPVTVLTERAETILTASLAGKTAGELADVALFRLEYGPTNRYGRTIEFFDWPEPTRGEDVKGRRFGYSRHFCAVLNDIGKNKTCYYRLTARDPAGLETQTTGNFKP